VGVFSLACLALGDPAINNNPYPMPTKDTGIKRLWKLFGWASERPANEATGMQQGPCYMPTTTPAPGPIPMCPLMPMPGTGPLQGGGPQFPILPGQDGQNPFPNPGPPSLPNPPPQPSIPNPPPPPPFPEPPTFPEIPNIPQPPTIPNPPGPGGQYTNTNTNTNTQTSQQQNSNNQFQNSNSNNNWQTGQGQTTVVGQGGQGGPQPGPFPLPGPGPQPGPQPGQYIPPGPQPGQYIPPGPQPGPGVYNPPTHTHVMPLDPIVPPRPYPTGLVPLPSDPVPAVAYCAGVPVGPVIPPSFFLADSSLQQQRCRDECRSGYGLDIPRCNLLDVLKQLRLRTIYSLVIKAGLEQLFMQSSRYTFFAPVDTAFEKLPDWVMQSLNDDIKLLRTFILNHFVKDVVSLSNIGNEYRIMNARPGGHRLRINIYHQDTDYRVYTVDGAKIILGEIPLQNEGILHVVDKVLTPNPPRTLAEYLAELPDFKQFMTAAVESGLLPMFQDADTPMTAFIPYNPAFKVFDYESIAGNVPAIQNFVNYHIVNGTYYSAGLLHNQYLTTNYYKEVKLGVSSDGFNQYADLINGRIRILKADIPLRNGVAHIIEHCLTYSREFLFEAEVNEFSMDFGLLKRSMALNKKELEEEFSKEH